MTPCSGVLPAGGSTSSTSWIGDCRGSFTASCREPPNPASFLVEPEARQAAIDALCVGLWSMSVGFIQVAHQRHAREPERPPGEAALSAPDGSRPDQKPSALSSTLTRGSTRWRLTGSRGRSPSWKRRVIDHEYRDETWIRHHAVGHHGPGCPCDLPRLVHVQVLELNAVIDATMAMPEFSETVETASPRAAEFAQTVRALGVAIAPRRVALRNELPGYITAVNYRSGARGRSRQGDPATRRQ